jgi:hypothetical protein
MTVEQAGRVWDGQWIWSHDVGISRTGEFMDDPRLAQSAHDRRVLFRRVIEISSPPGSAPLHITADSRYVLWVNGRELSRGPVRGHPAGLRYDTVDAAPALVRGRNVVAVLVRFYGFPTAWWMPATPTFSHGAGALLAEMELPDRAIGTDQGWRCLVAGAWSPQAPSGVGQSVPEVLDGRLLDPAWLTAEFDDSAWRPARVMTAIHLGGSGRTRPPTDPYGPLLRRPIPQPDTRLRRVPELGVRTAAPRGPDPGVVAAIAQAVGAASTETGRIRLPGELDVDAGRDLVLTGDWGEVVGGTLRLDIEAPAGTRVDARMCERLDAGGGIPAHHYPHGLRYVCRGTADRFEAGDPSGGRYVIVVVRGSGRVRINSIGIMERRRPRPAGARFTSSDAVLDRIFETGLRTVDLCAQDAYVDCPTREQRAWTGDSVVHQAVDLVTNPDWSLATWHPRLAASPRPDGMLPMAVACDFEDRGSIYIPDWALHWVRSLHNLYRWTGDRDVVADLLPTAEGVLRWFARFARGGLLTDVTGWVLLDWASVQGRGAGAVLNGLWGRALRDFAEMSRWLGDHGREAWAEAQHAALASAYQIFWDRRRGGYRDWLHAGEVAPGMSEHATAAAVVGGLVPARHAAAALRFLLDRAPMVTRAWSFETMPLRVAMGPPAPDWDVHSEVVRAQPFFRYVVHDAVAELGGALHVADLCRDWDVFLERGEHTWPETWGGGSRCHGWSSTPTRDLPLYTLGVQPAAPGYVRASVAPRPGRLDSLSGAVPTPHGLIEVAVADCVEVSCPVPFELDLGGTTRTSFDAGRHRVPRPAERGVP